MRATASRVKTDAFGDTLRVSPGQVAAFRLSRQHLATRAPASDLVRVAGDMAGAQAQVLSAAQMSLWARTADVGVADIEKALWQDRTLLKAWCMRGSLHLIPSDDFAVFVRGCARREARSADWFRRARIPMGPVNRIIEAVPSLLDEPLTRKEIGERLARALHLKTRGKAGRGWGGPSNAEGFVFGRHVLSSQWMVNSACARGLACFGPLRGNEVTFVRPDRWLPKWRDLPQAEAEEELLRRYLRAHGPATVTDFAQWTYVKAGDAREIWSRVEDELAPVNVDGRTGWLLRRDISPLERAGLERVSVRLLPFFDSFLLGLKDKGHLVDAAHYKQVYRPQGWLAPVVLIDGRAAGVWSHERKGRTVSIRVEAFRPLPRTVRSRIVDEANDLGRFLGAEDVRFRLAGSRRPLRPRRTIGPARRRT
jgi:uncharacterized protein YcaQ